MAFYSGSESSRTDLLLKQILAGRNSRYILCPNQHVGAWQVGFMPEWIAQILTERGVAKFSSNLIEPARCPLLGYAMKSVTIEGQNIGNIFLKVETQPEVGFEGYDIGTRILMEFFETETPQYFGTQFNLLGGRIIETLLNDGSVKDFENCIKSDLIEENYEFF